MERPLARHYVLRGAFQVLYFTRHGLHGAVGLEPLHALDKDA